MPAPSRTRKVLGLVSALVLAAQPAKAQAECCQVAAAVTLQELLELAREQNPRLHAAHSLADATSTREATARLLPDPTLQVGVMNLALPEFSTAMPASMAPAIQAMQVFPFPGKLSLQGAIAEQATAMARAGADEVWWDVRTKTAIAFYALYSTDRQLRVLKSTQTLLKQFETVATAMYATGTGRQADVLRASVEIARIDADIARMGASRVGVVARLNALLARPAETPIGPAVLGSLASTLPPADVLRGWAEETRPLLERGRIDVDRADNQVALARKQIWPNLGLGVQYGQRDTSTGTQHMGGIMLGFSLPIFAGRRQYRLRDEAEAMRQVADAQLGDARAQVDLRIGESIADLDWSRTLIRLYQQEILPQAKATVESSFSSYRVGTVDFMTLLDAQMAVNRFEGELYVFFSKYGTALAELEQAIGRDLPTGGETLTEVP